VIKVAFLLDVSNDWLSPYLDENVWIGKQYVFNKIYDEAAAMHYDIVFVLGVTKILKKEILKSNSLLLVVHESNLPEGRGFSPLQWQILEGKNVISACLLEVTEEVDSGPIFDKIEISLDGTELYLEIRKKQAAATIDLVQRFLDKHPNHDPKKQIGKPTFYRKRTALDSKLDIDKTLREQFNLLRIANNEDWPAFFEIGGSVYSLKIEKINEN